MVLSSLLITRREIKGIVLRHHEYIYKSSMIVPKGNWKTQVMKGPSHAKSGIVASDLRFDFSQQCHVNSDNTKDLYGIMDTSILVLLLVMVIFNAAHGSKNKNPT